jgi:hypothetical protein
MQGGFRGGMRCRWMDERYRFLIPTSPQYINRVFVPYKPIGALPHWQLEYVLLSLYS